MHVCSFLLDTVFENHQKCLIWIIIYHATEIDFLHEYWTIFILVNQRRS